MTRPPAAATLLLALLAGCAERAIEPYDPGVLEPQIPEVLAALREGRPEDALAVLDRLAARPDAPAGLDHWRGLALADAGRPDAALEALQRELSAHPGNAEAHALAADALLSLGRLEEAGQHVERAAALAPGLPSVPLLAGRVALQAGDDDTARGAFAAYLLHDRIGPRAAEAHHALAQVAARAGDEPRATAHEQLSQHLERCHQYLQSYEQRLADDPRDADAALGVGLVHLDLYRSVQPQPLLLERSGQALAAALALRPDDVKTLFNLGYVRTLQGRLDEAQALNERALQLAPGHPGVLLNSGLLARERGDLARAEQHLAAVAEAGESAERLPALVALGELLAALGRDDEAAARWEEALALDPSDPRDLASRLAALRGG